MLQQVLKDKNLILASQSPRRSFFLNELNLDFEVRTKEVDEIYPDTLKGQEITEYLSKLKASVFIKDLKKEDVLITADTIVWFENKALGKPKNKEQAVAMLTSLSGRSHQVISSIAITMVDRQILVSDTTSVSFKKLSKEEIDFYIETYLPYDKAGSYGIQEWLGYIAVEKIEGNHFNVMGFPVQKFFKALLEI